MVAVFHDLGAARVKTLELSHQAQHDFMTDLPNRSLLNDRVTQQFPLPGAIANNWR